MNFSYDDEIDEGDEPELKWAEVQEACDPAEPAPYRTGADVARVRDVEDRYIIHAAIPRVGVTAFFAEPKIGTTHFFAWLAAYALRQGLRVIYLSDFGVDFATFVKFVRLHEPDNLEDLIGFPDHPRFPRDAARLAKIIEQDHRGHLVILDRFERTLEVDENPNSCFSSFYELAAYAREKRIAVVGSTSDHYTKRAAWAYARNIIEVEKPPKGSFTLWVPGEKVELIPNEPLRFSLTQFPTGHTTTDPYGNAFEYHEYRMDVRRDGGNP